MNNSSVSIIITAPVNVVSKQVISTIDKELGRGCDEFHLMPIPFYLMMQRMVYYILSKHDFHPMNEEQEIFDEIEDLLSGNSTVSKLCFAVLERFIELREGNVSKGLVSFSNEVIEPTKIHRESFHDPERVDHESLISQGEDIESFEKKRSGDGRLQGSDYESVQGNDEGSVQVSEGSMDDSATVLTRKMKAWSVKDILFFPDPLILIFAGQLLSCLPCTPLARLLMYCLSILNNAPFHKSVLDSLETNIKKYSSQVSEENTLSSVLKKFHVIVPFPAPVIKPPIGGPKCKPETMPLYYIMPEAISEALYLSLTQQDKAVACAILDQTLNEILSRRYEAALEGNFSSLNASDEEDVHYFDALSLHAIGLKKLLLVYLVDEWSVFERNVIEGVLRQYVADKMDTMGDYGVLQLVSSLKNHQINV